jgi:1,4-dihydroxy-6-naphthoate synthase
MLSLAISPCPNDTFIFAALANRYRLVLDDVEALNARAEAGEFDIVKLSVAAYGRVRERYALLRAGGAAGFGVGPIVVAAARQAPEQIRVATTSARHRGQKRFSSVLSSPGTRVAIPGERTTAALLLRMLGAFDTVPMRFDRIEDAVARRDVDAGVLIHEGRFTYAAKGLVQLIDLGEMWEQRMHAPLPLGAIAIRRSLGPEVARQVDDDIRDSLQAAWDDRESAMPFVLRHAQEMAADVVQQHIDLYVNEYTRQLDIAAVERLVTLGESMGLYPSSSQPIFAF